MFTLICLLAAGRPFPAFAAHSSAASAHSSPGATHFSAAPLANSPANGRLTDSQLSELNSVSQANRLSTGSDQIYDIVPPTHPNLTPTGPLPGYQLVRLGRGHNNRLCLAGTVGDIKGLMMLDTGANNTALSDGTYRSLLSNAAYKLPAGAPRAYKLNGASTPLAEAPDFYVGKSNLGAVPVSLVPRRYLFDATSLDGQGRFYDGLLGENILRHYNAIIDCGRLMLYLDIDPARKLNLSSSFVRHGWTRVSMSDTGNHFAVPCVLNGRRFRLIVDTGAPFTNLDHHLLAAAQIGSHDLSVRGGLIGMQAEPVGLVELDHLQIGDYTATGVHMTTTAQSLAAFAGRHDSSTDGPIVGLLGGDILASNGAVIDIGNKALYLKQTVGKTTKRQ